MTDSITDRKISIKKARLLSSRIEIAKQIFPLYRAALYRLHIDYARSYELVHYARAFPSPISHTDGKAISMRPSSQNALAKTILDIPGYIKEIYGMLYVLKRLLLNRTKISLHPG